MSSSQTKTVFITGASSGIGEHLAYAYARRGAILGLAARRQNLLEEVRDRCRDSGAKEVYIYSLDVTDEKQCQSSIAEFVSHVSVVDIVIANAGIGGRESIMEGDPSGINRVFRTNLLGVTNTVIPFLPTLKEQQSGQIAIISSVAGLRGLPDRAGYSGSKAAVRLAADAWRKRLRFHGISITTIIPGFIDTPLTRKNRFPMPFLMDPDEAAEAMVRAIAKRKKQFILPWPWRLLAPIIKAVPEFVINWAYAPQQTKS